MMKIYFFKNGIRERERSEGGKKQRERKQMFIRLKMTVYVYRNSIYLKETTHRDDTYIYYILYIVQYERFRSDVIKRDSTVMRKNHCAS